MPSAAFSQQLAYGDGYVEYTVAALGQYIMVGLSNGNTDTSYGDIDYAMYQYGDNTLHVYKRGVYQTGGWPGAVGDKLRVAVEGNTILFSRNGTWLATINETPMYPLLVDTALYNSGGQIVNAVVSRGFREVTKYYYLGGKRIAMRNASGVTYLHRDHLGSASLTTDATGSILSQARSCQRAVRRHAL